MRRGILWVLMSLGALWAMISSFLRKSSAKVEADKAEVKEGVSHALLAEKLREKVAEAHKAKIEAQVELEKARDSVDTANDLLRTLDAAGEHKSE